MYSVANRRIQTTKSCSYFEILNSKASSHNLMKRVNDTGCVNCFGLVTRATVCLCIQGKVNSVRCLHAHMELSVLSGRVHSAESTSSFSLSALLIVGPECERNILSFLSRYSIRTNISYILCMSFVVQLSLWVCLNIPGFLLFIYFTLELLMA